MAQLVNIVGAQVRAAGDGTPVAVGGELGAGAWWDGPASVVQVGPLVSIYVPDDVPIHLTDQPLSAGRLSWDLAVHVDGAALDAGAPGVVCHQRTPIGAPPDVVELVELAGPCYVTYDVPGRRYGDRLVLVQLVGRRRRGRRLVVPWRRSAG